MTIQQRNRRSLRQWLLGNWLEILLILIFLAALAWIGSTTRSLWPQLAAVSQTTPLPPTDVPAISPEPTPTIDQPPGPPQTPLPEAFDGLEALSFANALLALGPRPAGSPANAAAADFIADELLRLGWQVERTPFQQDGLLLRNVVARFSPDNAAGDSAGLVVIAAPFDTRPISARETDPARQQQPPLGANDGASGPALLLELARSLDKEGLAGPVWLAFLDGQALGEERRWADGPGMQVLLSGMESPPRALILLNLVGGVDQQFAFEGNSDVALQTNLWRIAAGLGYDPWFIPEMRHTIADATPLAETGLPLVNIIDLDYPYRETVEDTADKLSAESLERVGRVLQAFLESLP